MPGATSIQRGGRPQYGIGYMFFFWFGQFNMTQMLSWIVLFIVLMLVIEHGLFAPLERRAFA